jgi:glutaredoxin
LISTSLFLVLMMISPVTQGDLYKWVDKNGKIHYGDSPPDNVKLKKITGNVSSFTSVSVEPFVYDPKNITKRKTSKSVVMYSTSWCGYCKKAARYFRQKKIPFTEYDIEKSAKAANEYKKLRGRGVPVILIGDRRMNGFSVKAFDSIYYANS